MISINVRTPSGRIFDAPSRSATSIMDSSRLVARTGTIGRGHNRKSALQTGADTLGLCWRPPRLCGRYLNAPLATKNARGTESHLSTGLEHRSNTNASTPYTSRIEARATTSTRTPLTATLCDHGGGHPAQCHIDTVRCLRGDSNTVCRSCRLQHRHLCTRRAEFTG